MSGSTEFKLLFNKAVEEYNEAKAEGITTRPVVLGPVSYLVLAKAGRDASPGFKPITLLEKLLPVYKQLLTELKAAGAEWVQIDEPVLVMDVAEGLAKQYATAYSALASVSPKIILATYYGRLDTSLEFVAKLPVAGLHIDLNREPRQLEPTLAAVKSAGLILSLGAVSGRNVWKNDFAASIKLGQKAVSELGQDRVIVATSSSLLHIPVTLESEKKLTAEQKDWFSFALEKASEVAVLAAILKGSQDAAVSAALEANKKSIDARRKFEATSDDAVRKRVAAITDADLHRKSPFTKRWEAQKALDLPKFPTTTIGSFPVSMLDAIANSLLIFVPIRSKPKRFALLGLNSAKANLLPSSTRSSSRRRSRKLSTSRRKSALTFLYTENLSAMIWFSTSANGLTALSSLRTPGCKVTVLGNLTC